MKNTTQFLKLAFLFLTFISVISCNQECDCSKHNLSDAATRAVDMDINKSFKDRLVSSMSDQVEDLSAVPRFTFSTDMLPEDFDLEDLELLSIESQEGKSEASANVEATELVTSIFNALIAAENEANILDVDFTMSDDPVENGSFIFGINTEDDQNLTLMMYDEEGFGMVANNQFTVNEGNNYKALNVSNLEPGSYIFKLRNDEKGKELVRKVEIAK